MKSGNLNFLEPSGPLQDCNGTALPFFTLEIWCTAHFKDHWFRRLPFNLLTKGWIFCLLSYSDSSAAQQPARDVPRFFRSSLLLRSRKFGSLISRPARITVTWSVSTWIVWQFSFVKNKYSHERFIVYVKKHFFSDTSMPICILQVL